MTATVRVHEAFRYAVIRVAGAALRMHTVPTLSHVKEVTDGPCDTVSVL